MHHVGVGNAQARNGSSQDLNGRRMKAREVITHFTQQITRLKKKNCQVEHDNRQLHQEIEFLRYRCSNLEGEVRSQEKKQKAEIQFLQSNLDGVRRLQKHIVDVVFLPKSDLLPVVGPSSISAPSAGSIGVIESLPSGLDARVGMEVDTSVERKENHSLAVSVIPPRSTTHPIPCHLCARLLPGDAERIRKRLPNLGPYPTGSCLWAHLSQEDMEIIKTRMLTDRGPSHTKPSDRRSCSLQDLWSCANPGVHLLPEQAPLTTSRNQEEVYEACPESPSEVDSSRLSLSESGETFDTYEAYM